MDVDLVEFLTSIPDEQLLRPGFRRCLLRRALSGTVPAEVFNRRQKAVVVRGAMSALGLSMSSLAELRGRFEVVRHHYADEDRLWDAIRQAAMTRSDNLVGIIRVLGLEHWLRDSSVAFQRVGCALRHPGVAPDGPPANEDFSAAAQTS